MDLPKLVTIAAFVNIEKQDEEKAKLDKIDLWPVNTPGSGNAVIQPKPAAGSEKAAPAPGSGNTVVQPKSSPGSDKAALAQANAPGNGYKVIQPKQAR